MDSSNQGWTALQYFSPDCRGAFPSVPLMPKNPSNFSVAYCQNVTIDDENLVLYQPGFTFGRVLKTSMDAVARFSATSVRILFTAPASADPLMSYVAINFMDIKVNCKCYGHAVSCSGQNGATCNCLNNTAGQQCSSCLPLYNNQPWQMGNKTCQECSCNGHASSCVYDLVKGRGVCNCTDNTAGDRCDTCAPGYYVNPNNRNSTAPSEPFCLACSCNPAGTNPAASNTCDVLTGQCTCKPRVTQRDCSQCLDTFWGLGTNLDLGCNVMFGPHQSQVWPISKSSVAHIKVKCGHIKFTCGPYQSQVWPISKSSVAHIKVKCGPYQSQVWPISKSSVAHIKVKCGPYQSQVWPISKSSVAHIKVKCGPYQSQVWPISKSSVAHIKVKCGPYQSQVWPISKSSVAHIKVKCGPYQSQVWPISNSHVAHIKVKCGPYQSQVWPISKSSVAHIKFTCGPYQSQVWPISKLSVAHIKVKCGHIKVMSGLYQSQVWPISRSCVAHIKVTCGPYRACSCNTTGTVNNTNNCNKTTGQCLCKVNVEGDNCNQCKNLTYGYSGANPLGCSPCDCDPGASTQLACATDTGQCTCLGNIGGRDCRSPPAGYFVPRLDVMVLEPETYTAENVILRSGHGTLTATVSGRGFVNMTSSTNINITFNSTYSGLVDLVIRYETTAVTMVTLNGSLTPLSSYSCQDRIIQSGQPWPLSYSGDRQLAKGELSYSGDRQSAKGKLSYSGDRQLAKGELSYSGDRQSAKGELSYSKDRQSAKGELSYSGDRQSAKGELSYSGDRQSAKGELSYSGDRQSAKGELNTNTTKKQVKMVYLYSDLMKIVYLYSDLMKIVHLYSHLI
ncbi:hypothetical protein Btru_010839 [Bulinus truncatus]|nr:hypothetical protein Btru_010839 [Bulinus truncatus]